MDWLGRPPVRRWLRRLAPALMLAGVCALDLLMGKEPVLGLVVIAPLLGANIIGPRLTGVYGVASVLCAAALGLPDQYRDGALPAQLSRLVLIAVAGALAVAAAAVRERREARLADVLRVADVAQRAVLPPVPDRVGMLRLAAHYESAAREASLGGDLYAALPTSHGVRLLIGDVRGKGLEAVRLASVILGAFRERAHERPDLRTLAADLDRAVCRVAGPEDFITAVLAQVDDECYLTVVNAGHPGPLLVRHGIAVPLSPAQPSPPLGLGTRPVPLTLELEPGDRLLLYTDGMTEARRPKDRTFFPAERLVTPTLGSGSLDEGLGALRAALVDWADGHLDDDVALLAVEVDTAVRR
jgi:serine phosphatase RsbU (regulator of sigma subunit)